jgi:hypothetical protein
VIHEYSWDPAGMTLLPTTQVSCTLNNTFCLGVGTHVLHLCVSPLHTTTALF